MATAPEATKAGGSVVGPQTKAELDEAMRLIAEHNALYVDTEADRPRQCDRCGRWFARGEQMSYRLDTREWFHRDFGCRDKSASEIQRLSRAAV